ncbi:hypothetical protein HMPREF1147_1704 [Selenomonas sp. FOBRC9]|uniref:hypothetical protein n=1 Tax=Selenomonas sp. FOBRC9 TaxID=936573 RepID=UPI00027A3DCC|nr:hypothetical protein [Selenomonas sp. FOBRC9]EJP28309.1 hypothetical protein HMPREF1147_1704 [Selenomonas sp. FOBRC9]
MMDFGTRQIERTAFQPKDGIKIKIETYQRDSIVEISWRTYITATSPEGEEDIGITLRSKENAIAMHEGIVRLIEMLGFVKLAPIPEKKAPIEQYVQEEEDI